jgi:iron complex outermembrane receptor protein
VLALPAAAQRPPEAAAAAPGSLKGLSLEQLGNIEVTTVSKDPVKVMRTPAAIYVITQEDIRRSGVTSLPEALRLAPGVEVARIDSVKWAIGIRGFQSRLSRDVLVLIDGRTVYSPSFHGVYWEVQDTLLEDIDRIEVIRGPGGTIWGANAVDGVINIITRNSKDTKGTLVSAGGGSVDQGFLDVRYGGGNDQGFTYRVYAKGTTQSPEFHYDNKQFDDWRRAQAGFRTDWDVTPRDALSIQGDLYDGLAGESVRITSLSPPFSSIVNQNADLSGGNLLAHWTRTLSGGSDIQLQTYYDRVSRRQANQAEYRNTFDFDFVHHLHIPKGQEFTWGVGGRISLGDLPAIIPTYVFLPSRRTDQIYSAFAQDQIPLAGDRLSLTLGSKLLHSSFSGFDLEPSARLLWTPTTRQSLWTAVTRAVRTPSDIEDTLTSTTLVSTNPLTFDRTQGDGKFTSETLISYELGYRAVVTSSLTMGIATFYNRYNHLLSLQAGTPITEISLSVPYVIVPVTNVNQIAGSTSGFEIVPGWKPTAWWRLQGSYAFLNMDLHTKPGCNDTTTVPTAEGSSPRHQVVIQSYFDLSKKLEFSQVWRYISALRAQGVPAYETADVRFAWRPTRFLELSVTGQNLLQPHHTEYGGDPAGNVAIKRSVFAAVTWKK